MTNLTLSVDEQAVEAAREVARAQGTSLQEMLRAYIDSLAKKKHGADTAKQLRAHWRELDKLPAKKQPYKFDREEIYAERLDRYGKKHD